jgi:hypothetical protein
MEQRFGSGRKQFDRRKLADDAPQFGGPYVKHFAARARRGPRTERLYTLLATAGRDWWSRHCEMADSDNPRLPHIVGPVRRKA